jgi:DNA mismatch repair protein MutS
MKTPLPTRWAEWLEWRLLGPDACIRNVFLPAHSRHWKNQTNLVAAILHSVGLAALLAASMSDAGQTPMMKQYHAMRRSLPQDVLLFFRLGDFYEMFFEDAKVAASILNLALTKRNDIPMCGVPYHSATGYIARLIRGGKRVAIAEQTTEPVPGKLVEREISQVISAGTVIDLNMLESRRNNYLAAVYRSSPKLLGLAVVDHTTGEFRVAEFAESAELDDELGRLQPAEVIHADEQTEEFGAIKGATAVEAWPFLYDQAHHFLLDHFKVQSLDGFGCGGMKAAPCAAGAILFYLRDVLRRNTAHIRRMQRAANDKCVIIDAASRANLDLVSHRSGQEHTLLAALDRTNTPMGARRLRDWILHPLRELEPLRARQDVIEALIAQPFILTKCRETLKDIRDIERTLGRLNQAGNARDMQVLGQSLMEVPNVRAHLEALGGGLALVSELAPRLRDFHEVTDLIARAIVDEPPGTTKDGGLIRDGWNAELDEIRRASTDGKQWVADLQTREIERTGISSLKVKFNAVFGYFIEITKANLAKVPLDYTRKQTTANGERFITPELKQMEDKILGADERAKRIEFEEFQSLRTRVLEHMDAIQDTADALAVVDVLCGLTETARLFNYCRPLLNDSLSLYIKDGRHPVLDQNLTEEKFVPNDVLLEPGENRLIILTGPNMAGKSTYIRQVALLTLMAQTGSFIPAARAEIGLVDRIFTRVGASDDLSRGQSTFMVEMNETAAILNNATDRSLVILDEIGRGTATFDGLAIAWSVAEHLHDEVQCRTIFATHYHELTALSDKRPAVRNANVAVREWNDRIIFLRKIIPGAADKSYGIQVARLAGLPQPIIERAKQILGKLEGGSHHPDGPPQENSVATMKKPRAKKTASAEEVNGPVTRQVELELF